MGHISVKGLQHAADGVDFDNSHLPSCTICARANITCTPFPHHATHRATCLLEWIHCDICGPLPTCFGDYRYFILFICCHSRYILLYLIKTRKEALQSFTQFQTLVENFCRKKITILRVDNAPELTKGKFKRFCTTEGISYEKTIPDSPSQNGVAECCNRTLASMARALLIDTDLSDWFWPFAIQTTVHIKNRIPHSILPPNKTPFKFWHGYKPDLSHLRPFGTQCMARIISNTLSKFDPHGESGRFLSYAKDAKGYIIWVPGPNNHGGSIKTCWDVVFHDFPREKAVPPVNDDLSPLWDDIVDPDLSTCHNKTYAPPKNPKT
jgi:transposase InsO family protein